MADMNFILNFASEYWVIILVAGFMLLSVVTQLMGAPTSVDIKFNISDDPGERQSKVVEQARSAGAETRIEFTSDDLAFKPVIKALQKGDKITAIKLIREAKGLSLVDAKNVVDALDRMKDKFSAHQS